MTHFVCRFDDITPGMCWEKFHPFDALASELNIPFLVGVVPDCRDDTLNLRPSKPEFWDVVRGWRARGWTIAQHGYTHEYSTDQSGLLNINPRSEFAGQPEHIQLARLREGKRILEEQGVWDPVFMAPGHSFDAATVDALAILGFTHITDGYGVYPYRIRRLMAVPQLFSTPKHAPFGVYTICLHVNSMTNQSIARTLDFLREHASDIVSFEQAAAVRCPVPAVASVVRGLSSSLLRTARWARRMKAGR